MSLKAKNYTDTNPKKINRVQHLLKLGMKIIGRAFEHRGRLERLRIGLKHKKQILNGVRGKKIK